MNMRTWNYRTFEQLKGVDASIRRQQDRIRPSTRAVQHFLKSCQLHYNNGDFIGIVCFFRRSSMKQIRSWVFAGLVAFLTFVAVVIAPGDIQAQALQKVRIAIPTINVLTRPWYIAKEKGFYAAEGLDPEFIYVQGTLQPPALVNGEIDFAGSGDTGVRAAANGVPIKLVFAMTHRPDFMLVVRPEIKSGKDLRGKKIAVSSIGSLTAVGAKAAAGALGLNPDTDIFLLAMGEQTNRFAAVQAGSADGMIVDPGLALAAQKKGFHILSRVGEQLELIQMGLSCPIRSSRVIWTWRAVFSRVRCADSSTCRKIPKT
jgi:ABC-type amino acid transport substrate-binding protein